MRLTVTTFVTMDGVMQSTGLYMNEVFDAADAFLLGRFSYQAMAAFWPQVNDPANRVAAQFNSCPKYVVTETLADLSWAGAVPLRGDIPKQVAELKQTPGRELQIHGSGALARSLMPHGLIDAYRLVIFPVVLGRGQRLFADGTPPATMRLVDTRSTGSGVVMHTYEAAGAPAFGSVQPGDVISDS